MSQETPPHEITQLGATPVKGRIANAQAQIRWCLGFLHDVQQMSPTAALDGLALAKKLRRYAAALERTFQSAAEAEMQSSGTRELQGDGFIGVLHTDGPRRDWRSESLVNEVADRYIADVRRAHPELPPAMVRKIALGAMNKLAEAGRIEWRSTSLREMGVDPDEFSRKEANTRMSVEMRGEAVYVEPEFRAVRRSA